MAQLNRSQDSRQASLESQLGALGIVLALLEHDELRIQQAIRRTGQDHLLGPVLDDFSRARREIQSVRRQLRKTWESGQNSKWDETEH